MRSQVPQVKSDYLGKLDEAWAQHLEPRAADAPTLISTFSGCGGSSLGYSMAGYRELLAIEWDQEAAETFRRNFEGVAVFEGNIIDLSIDRCLELASVAPGECDLLDGSPPCQGFSTAGHRSLSDDRSQLFRQFVRILRGVKPKAFVMENVAGLVSGRMRKVFVVILKELKASGYRVIARKLNAKYFGVAQSRERLIFIGIREDLDLEPSHPKPISRPTTIWQAIGHLGNEQDPGIGHVWLDESAAGRNTKTWMKAFKAKAGANYAGGAHKSREEWDKPAHTLTTGGLACAKNSYLRGQTCHPRYTRTWSSLECRLLSSFPEAFKFEGNVGLIARQTGNCVPPLFMRAISAHVRGILARHCAVTDEKGPSDG